MKLIPWSVLLVYLLFILYLSTRSMGGVELFEHADKVIHFMIYGIMAVLSAWALTTTDLADYIVQYFFASVLIASSYGAFMEFVQGLLQYRSAELGDIVANTAGALVGAAFSLLFYKERECREND